MRRRRSLWVSSMDTRTITNWLQIAAGFAVLIGLGFVAYELKQSREIAQAQLLSDGFLAHASRRIAMMGEHPALTIAKACSEPDDLTAGDMIVLNSYYESYLSVSLRSRTIAKRTGVFPSSDEPSYDFHFREVFQTPYGRFWWTTARAEYSVVDPDFVDSGNRVLKSFAQSPNCTGSEESYAAYLSADNTR